MASPGAHVFIYPVTDLAGTKAIFTALVGEPHTDEPYYVGFNVNGQEIGLDPNGHDKGMQGPVAYWTVADLDASIAELKAAGATVEQEPTAVGGTRRIAVVSDADGNTIGLLAD